MSGPLAEGSVVQQPGDRLTGTPWPRVRLSELLIRSEASRAIRADETYSEITVRLWGRGVVLRRHAAGAEIASPRRYVARTDQLILSRIDARNGAIGVVPATLDGAVVSSDFPLFDIDATRALPRFVEWLTQSASFVDLCRSASEGTTNRVRLQEDRFLGLDVALPPLREQRRIVAKLDQLSANVEAARVCRDQGLATASALDRSLCERAYRAAGSKSGFASISDVCLSVTDGDHLTPEFSDHGVTFIFVGNVSTGKLHFEGSKHVAQAYFDWLSESRRPKRGDVLYSAVGATLGVPAIVDSDRPFCFQRHVAILRPNPSKFRSAEFVPSPSQCLVSTSRNE